MISSSDFNVLLLGNWVLEHTQHTEEERPGGGCHRATVDNEAELVAASARISCPLASSYLTVSVQDLMSADRSGPVAEGINEAQMYVTLARLEKGGFVARLDAPTQRSDRKVYCLNLRVKNG